MPSGRHTWPITWFRATRLDADTTLIIEPHIHVLEQANMFLVEGSDRDMILDTGMGVIPFEFTGGDNRKTLGPTGDGKVAIHGLDDIKPLAEVPCTITYGDGSEKTITLKCRIDTAVEIEYVENGGVLHYVLRNLAKSA